MTKFIFTLSFLLVTTNLFAANFPTKESGNYEKYCKDNWTKQGKLDLGMYDFCMKNLIQDYDEIQIKIKTYQNQSWMQAEIDRIVSSHSKMGVRDDSQVNYVLGLTIEGWEEMNYQEKQPNYNKEKHELCFKKWKSDFNMVAYCYKK